MALLPKIHSPADIKHLSHQELVALAAEIRQEIIEVTAQNGGHIGPNLGVVELTLAMHRIFDTPKDNFVFDVSHQGYVHKLLTGRYGPQFRKIRQAGGLSGFLAREESEHDCYGAGHAGTGLSAALGMATARDLRGGDEHVVGLIGDAAFTCGITLEALNNVTSATQRLVIILNDNEWSIARNVGAIARYLNELITNPVYNRLHKDLEHVLHRLPGGHSLLRFGGKAKREAKDFLVPSSLFEKFGLRYLGPIDGHDLELLEQYLTFCRNSSEPVLLHVLTKKGRGYEVAIDNPEKFHGTSPFHIETGKSKSKGKSPPKYQDVLGTALTRFARNDKRIVGITAAMPSGTGLNILEDALPGQFFDVGIAEEHAVLFACGLATKGMKPVCTIYSTFLQRAYDPIIHDVCLQNLDVTFCLDRAGLSPNDGPTHHGLFDFAYLRCIPRTVLMQPKDEDELVDMLHTALEHPGPAFVRYPRGAGEGVPIKDQPSHLVPGTAERLREGADIALWALGPFVKVACELARQLEEEQGLSVAVVNARFVRPLDTRMLRDDAAQASLLVTLEDHVVNGGFGSAVLETLAESGTPVPVVRIGWPDSFVEHGTSVEQLRKAHGLDNASIKATILARYEQLAHNAPAPPRAFGIQG